MLEVAPTIEMAKCAMPTRSRQVSDQNFYQALLHDDEGLTWAHRSKKQVGWGLIG